MTSGEIYNQNKQYYDKLAKEYIKNINDICYVPFTMQTHYTRSLIKKVNHNLFYVFDGLVEFINSSDDTIEYNSTSMINKKDYSYKDLIELCGFEYSLNPYYRKEIDV